ncbi:hypothetical protein A374_10153 [Fictibacillus macauensis ZFHKF-1]|uniref:Uncharacterized protein n=1 Tax=Fictibacillus macauensis ZFHKF-1 TaxID=1196324 RepID=I8UFC0_9BACL|nr:hypothetical protein [Fictibacillus macauensis]EIT85590.1 hypothetical protein A374_10153 [Fictibacillus macauensis ZFHKF-1]
MDVNSGDILIMFPDEVSEHIVSKLTSLEKQSIMLCVPSWSEAEKLEKENYKQIYVMPTLRNTKVPEVFHRPLSKVIIVETSFVGCCNAIEWIRAFYDLPVFVIKSDTHYLSRIYKDLGATYIIHNKTGNLSFLLSS